MLYDVIQVEDDRLAILLFEGEATGKGLSYLCACSLNSLETALKEHQGKAFVVDGRFPRATQGEILELAEEAIILIQRRCPEAPIFLYSAGGIAVEKNFKKI